MAVTQHEVGRSPPESPVLGDTGALNTIPLHILEQLAVCCMPSATFGKGFAECLGHSAKQRNPVVYVVFCQKGPDNNFHY